MRNFTALSAAVLLALWAQAASADGAAPRNGQQSGPLKPGRSAGVRVAQLPRTGLALVGASAIIAIVVGAAGSGGGNGSQPNLQSAPTTTAP